PGSRELLSSIFRTIHTIKGTSGFLALHRLESLTHVGENVLSRLRDGRLELEPTTTTVLLQMVDAVRALLARIESHGDEEGVETDAVVTALTAILEGQPVGTAAPAPETAIDSAPETVIDSAPETVIDSAPEAQVAATPEAHDAPAPAAPAATSGDPVWNASDDRLGQLLLSAGVDADVVRQGVALQAAGDQRQLGEILVEDFSTDATTVDKALQVQTPRRSAAESTIRVDVDLLDSLMTLVGELVLTRNQIVQHAGVQHDVNLLRASQRLNLIASELQEGVMKTRMQPIDHLWSKLPRVVRDLGQQCGRQVRLEMEGRETELDRTLLEAIKDPLTHLVRNSVDHGIEPPDVRVAAGKPAEGVLLLRAFHEGGQVIVEVVDDGKGVDPAVIGAKAVERGLVSPSQLAAMSPRDVLQLIFRPGFSTAAAVTNVSGRGVGMDVVKTNIEKIGGAIDVESVPGHGTTCRLRIPLTLAIIPALTVECAGDRFAIPQVSLLELVSLDAGRGDSKVEEVNGAPVYRLRGSLLPLVRLDEALGVAPAERGDGEIYIAVLQSDGRRFGLVVDRVLNTEEIVVKPLSAMLKGIGAYSGATILGDGGVALILDVQALAKQSLRGAEAARNDLATAAALETVATERYLVARVGERRIAIPLEIVTRLEEFPATSIERVGTREVVQYRGHILPLVRIGRHLGASYGDDDRETLQGIVYSDGIRSVALVVDAILDIVEEQPVNRSDVDDLGLVGSTVIQDRVTELLDVRQAILAADPHFYEREVDGTAYAAHTAMGPDEYRDGQFGAAFAPEVLSR
ncbi:MAG: chemotaxis protein CheA, partial [Actinomycetales bacterium]